MRSHTANILSAQHAAAAPLVSPGMAGLAGRPCMACMHPALVRVGFGGCTRCVWQPQVSLHAHPVMQRSLVHSPFFICVRSRCVGGWLPLAHLRRTAFYLGRMEGEGQVQVQWPVLAGGVLAPGWWWCVGRVWCSCRAGPLQQRSRRRMASVFAGCA